MTLPLPYGTGSLPFPAQGLGQVDVILPPEVLPHPDPVLKPTSLSLPLTEFEARVEKVRQAMQAQGLDALLVTFLPNLSYLTGYQTPNSDVFACLVLPCEGSPVLIAPCTHMSRAKPQTWVRSIVEYDQWSIGDDRIRLIQVLRDLALADKHIGIELAREGLNPSTFDWIQKQLENALFIDASDLVISIRLIKSPLELMYLRLAAKLTDIGMQAALSEVGPGKLDNDIAAAAVVSMIRAGSEYFSIDPFVMVGQRSGIPHATYKRIPIHEGDTVLIELAGVSHRYSAPLFRTAVVGTPSESVKRLCHLSIACLHTVLDNVRPGRPISQVAREVRKVLEPFRGEIWPRHYFGYAVGIGFPPTWTEESILIQEDNHRPFEPGMVFHSPQSIRLPGKLGVSFSETWVVSEEGVEVLGTIERELTVVMV